jgi:hypothetical protein
MYTISMYMFAPVHTASFDTGASQIKNASSDCLGKTVKNFDLRTLYTFKKNKKKSVKDPKK